MDKQVLIGVGIVGLILVVVVIATRQSAPDTITQASNPGALPDVRADRPDGDSAGAVISAIGQAFSGGTRAVAGALTDAQRERNRHEEALSNRDAEDSANKQRGLTERGTSERGS